MTISIGYHFTTIPIITHRDFPASDTRHSAFTAVTLTDEAGVEHHMYLPLGCRINMVAQMHRDKTQPVASTSTRTGAQEMGLQFPEQPVADDALTEELDEDARARLIAAVHRAGERMAIAESKEIAALRAELAAERERADKSDRLLSSLRMSLADRVPPDCNERFSMVNRIDAALAGKDGGK